MKQLLAISVIVALAGGTVLADITGSLTPAGISNVQAFGSTQTYTLDYSVTVAGAAGKADVMFLTDTTGSMGGYINGMKTAFSGILSSISSSLPGLDIHYGVADYKDYLDGGAYTNPGVNVGQTFTSNTAAAQSAINSLYAWGGYDGPEEQLKSLQYLGDNWLSTLSGRSDAQKILIWGGDVYGHFYGSGGDGPATWYPSVADTISSLNTQGIKVFGLNVYGEGSGIDGYNQADDITAATGGDTFNYVGSGGPSVQNAIVNAITGGVTTLTNITVSLDGSTGDFSVTPSFQTWTGSWSGTTVTGTFSFDATAPVGIGSATFDYVLLGNGAELDRSTIHLSTVPVPGAVLLGLLGLSAAGVRLRRFV